MQVSQKICLLAALIGLLGIGCTQTSTSTQAQSEVNKQIGVTDPNKAMDESKEREQEVQDEQVPTSLTNVGNYGEALYDTIKVKDWAKASANLKLLQQVSESLPSEIAQKE